MFTKKTLQKYIDKGLITERTHPEDENVCIYNYTPACQYAGAWDEVTMKCRGLIIHWGMGTAVNTTDKPIAEGEIVSSLDIKQGVALSNPIPKFFNWEEHIAKGKTIPNTIPTVYEKLDGWLGILYWLDGKPWIATRGSFTSTGAVWATEWFRKYVEWKLMSKNWTHVFEIISPGTKIVVDYKFEGLVWLTARDNFNDIDAAANLHNNFIQGLIPLTARAVTVPNYPNEGYVKTAKNISDVYSYEALKNLEGPNREGFVICYPDGLRLKIKFEEYKRLHKIMTNTSEKSIWEALRDGTNFEQYLDNVPDEFYNWVIRTKTNLTEKYTDIVDEVARDWKNCYVIPESEGATRKDIALKVKETKYPGVLFAMMDNKDYQKLVWKLIKPKKEEVFKQEN